MFRFLLVALLLTASSAHADPPQSKASPKSSTPPSSSTPSTKAPAGESAQLKSSSAEVRPAQLSVEKAEARYKELVRRAEAGEVVDFRELRLAWLHGPAMNPDPRREKVPELRKAMFEAMGKGGDHAVVLAQANEILDIVYVDLDAQKARRQACEYLGQKPCAKVSRVTSLGLLKSVVAGGDGASCATAWKVISIDEEYFVMRMLGAQLKKQQVVTEEGNTCDALLVESDEGEKTLYFEISELFEARARRMKLTE